MSDLNRFGSLIKRMRKSKGITIRELGERIARDIERDKPVSACYLSFVERGITVPSPSVVGAIARVLNIPHMVAIGTAVGQRIDTYAEETYQQFKYHRTELNDDLA